VRRALSALVASAVLAVPATTAAATPKKKVVIVTKSVSGSQVQVDRWGTLHVTLVVRKTTTTVGTTKKVTRKITAVKVPIYPDHTDRSVHINQQALPLLVQEVLKAQLDPGIELISGATDTSSAFEQSLQAALLQAKRL